VTSETRSAGEDQDVQALFDRLGKEPDARDRLVERFQPLAEYLARRFIRRGEPLEDLTQVANIGLLNAIDRFDAERGVPFSTFASLTIVGELKRHFRDRTWAVRVPRDLQELVLLYHRELPLLTQRLGRSPTVAEIAEHLDVPEEAIVEAIDAAQAYSTASLDAPTAVGGASHVEDLGDADESIQIVERWADLAPAIRELPERERRVLYLRFVRDLTQSEIAERIGVSQMHVSRILTQTLERLRASGA